MDRSKSESATAFISPGSEASRPHLPFPPQQQPPYGISALEAENYADFLEPAIERPPSPGRIRAFSNKVKQASLSERHVSQQTTSSGTSSLLSSSSHDRRPSWEQALESFSLSRKSSIRSTTSSMPSRERPESVQAIGKAIFHRKSKLRRESLATSGSSTYSGDMTVDSATERNRAASVSKDNLLTSMSLFNRRKTVQAGEEAVSQKRPLISSPFNFQHVTQIQRDQLHSLDHADHAALHKGFSGRPSPPALTSRTIRGLATEDLHLPNFSSRATRPHDDDESIPPHVLPRSRENSISWSANAQRSPPRQFTKPGRSQDHIPGVAPPRPPRSPTEMDMGYFNFAPPVPPARNPSRPSIPRRDSEALGFMVNERKQSMSGFRYPAHGNADSPPPSSSGCASPTFPGERRYSRIFLPTETPNWPLTCPLNNSSVTTFEAALPDVPEEEEQAGLPRRSRASVRSTNSSLRGSLSVPALRKMSVASSNYSSHDRNYNRESTIFGQFDACSPRQTPTSMLRRDEAEPLRRDSWEAVIDYCYEHEAEADCDYDWHRPSLELDTEPTVMVTESEDDCTLSSRPTSDLPALSPSSPHLSSGSTPEAITPTIPSSAKSPTRANFSLPRRDGLRPSRLHLRSSSHASFKESQGFTLSPSFLIPTDYHQELLAARSEQYQEQEGIAQAVTIDDSTMAMDSTNLFVPARGSASTTASASNASTRSVFERHISSTSTNTDYTRLTMSTLSVDMEPFIFKDDTPQAVTTDEPVLSTGVALSEPVNDDSDQLALPIQHARSQSAAGLLGGSNNSKSPQLSRDTHQSDSNLAGLQSTKKQADTGRTRSRTLSSTPGQFSLFPTVGSSNTSVKSPRI